jgi:hypothetical protein
MGTGDSRCRIEIRIGKSRKGTNGVGFTGPKEQVYAISSPFFTTTSGEFLGRRTVANRAALSCTRLICGASRRDAIKLRYL